MELRSAGINQLVPTSSTVNLARTSGFPALARERLEHAVVISCDLLPCTLKKPPIIAGVSTMCLVSLLSQPIPQGTDHPGDLAANGWSCGWRDLEAGFLPCARPENPCRMPHATEILIKCFYTQPIGQSQVHTNM